MAVTDNSGWIKLHRKFLDWEWFDKPDMVQLFLFLLISANHEEKKWRGVTIKRGQFVTSLESIKAKTGLSVRVIRTCLTRLKSTSEITTKTTNRFTMVTICNYDDYQKSETQGDTQKDKQNDKQTTNDRQSIDNQSTTTKNYKNYKNEENINTSPEKFNFKRAMIEYGFNSDLVNEWMVVRKSKKAVNSKLAFNKFITQVEKTGIDKNKLLDFIAVEKQWKSFNAEWLNNLKSNKESNPDTDRLEWLANYAAKAFEE